MAYTVEELIARFRNDIEDTVEPFLWSEVEVLEYLDEAQDDFVYKTRMFTRQITLAYTALDTTVNIPSYLVDVRRGFAPSGKRLTLVNEEEWADQRLVSDYGFQVSTNQWETDQAAEPTTLITDITTGKYRLYPIPTATDELSLNIFNTPLSTPIDGDELEVTDKKSQRIIMLKVHSLAYLKHDSQTLNKGLSDDFSEMYEEAVDKQAHRLDQRKRRPKAVAYGGY